MPRSRALVIGCVALLVTALVGCQNWKDWNWRGKGYDDDVNSLTKGYRPAGDERSFSGLDARARDIESNLGVR